MRGHVEESPEVIARRKLRAAARRYAGQYLVSDLLGREVDVAEEKLVEAAQALAETLRAPPTKRARPR